MNLSACNLHITVFFGVVLLAVITEMAEEDKIRVWGPVTRDLLQIFSKYMDEQDHLPIGKLRSACNDLNLYPSRSQVHEMVKCAVEYGSPCQPDHITYGEFCVLVSELQHYYHINPEPPIPQSLVRVRSDALIGRRKRRVFLGGSCNPTTWRADKAIPYFKEHGITFYNPQVQNWRPELMELEAEAKQMADILYFVIDSKTRAVSSMIEVAYLVATKRQVVVTMCDYVEPDLTIDGTPVSEREMNDLIRGRIILTDLIERNGVPIFQHAAQSLPCTKLIITQNRKVQDLTVADGAFPVKHGHLKLGQALLQLREAFNSVDSNNSGFLSSADVALAYKSCTGDDLDSKWLRRRKSTEQYIYEEFCGIVTECREETQSPSLLKKVIMRLLQPIRWLAEKLSDPEHLKPVNEESELIRDVYLGGSCGSTCWRTDPVQPLLRKVGLSYFDPMLIHWDQKFTPIHVSMREKCRLMLYMVTNETRSLAAMCEAAYYIGKGCRLVLCIQKLADNAVIGGEQVTSCGVRDYNRGRDYLCDLANREGVPLFDNVEEATHCAITILTESLAGSH